MREKQTNKKFSGVIVFILLASVLAGQVVSPFNKRMVNDTSSQYSFVVSGHFHGSSDNASTFPAATILAGIDTINALRPDFIMCLGDLFIDLDEKYIAHYQQSFFNKLKAPLLNAVGNHDLANGNMYEKIYGKTFYSFFHGSDCFIVLNTEQDDGSIEGEQLTFFKAALKDAEIRGGKNIFIFSHRPVWSENDPVYEKLFSGNTRTTFGKNNYEGTIQPLLVTLAKTRSVYWMSGSMAGGPASFFYNKEPETGIIFIQTAIRNVSHDAVLKVDVVNGKVVLSGVSLTGEKLETIERYTIDYWLENTRQKEPFSFRLLPYLIKKMLLHSYFWIGFFSSLLIVLLYFMVKRRKG